MVEHTSPEVRRLFKLYIIMRQRGNAMGTAIKELQPEAFRLPNDERLRLGQLVNEWETENAGQAVPPPAPTPESEVEPPPPVSRGPVGTQYVDFSKQPIPADQPSSG